MIELIERKRNVAEVNTLSPLTWAYVGDSVFELLVRTRIRRGFFGRLAVNGAVQNSADGCIYC